MPKAEKGAEKTACSGRGRQVQEQWIDGPFFPQPALALFSGSAIVLYEKDRQEYL